MIAEGAAARIINNGSVTITPPFTTTGRINWTGGTINGALTVGTGGVLALSGPAAKYLTGVVTNAGTMTLGSGLWFGNDNVQVVNLAGALLDVQGDCTIARSAVYSGLQIVNAGTFRKSAGTSNAVVSGIAVTNSGWIQVLAGTLQFTAAFANTGGGFATRLNSATDWGRIVCSSSVTLGGPLSVSRLPGYTPAVGRAFEVLSFGSISGHFTVLHGLDLGNGLKLVPRLTRRALTLVVDTYPYPLPEHPTLSFYRLPGAPVLWWPEGYTDCEVLSATDLVAPVWEPVATTGPNQVLIVPEEPDGERAGFPRRPPQGRSRLRLMRRTKPRSLSTRIRLPRWSVTRLRGLLILAWAGSW
jgi:hypothetical protein